NLGQLDEAETLLQELVSLDHADDASGPHYLLTIGLAEVALAKGSIEYGLSLLEQTRSYDRRRVPVPGMPTDDGLDPWNLMKYAIITAAYAQHSTGNHTKLFQTLLHRAVGATASTENTTIFLCWAPWHTVWLPGESSKTLSNSMLSSR